NGVTVGGFDPVNTAQTSRVLVSTGSGAVVVSGGTILVGGNSTGTAGLTATLDLSGATSFSFTGSELNLGGRQANNTGNRANGNMILSPGANSITVTTLNIGAGSNSNAGGNNNLKLGGGTNTINA